jgi:hypothetical protein
MDFDLGKLWIAGFAGLLGAVGGAWIWAQRAAGIAAKVAQGTNADDALIHTAANTGMSSLGAALQGAAFGAVLGLIAAGVYFYFSNPDRAMVVRNVDSGDETLGDAETGLDVRKIERHEYE